MVISYKYELAFCLITAALFGKIITKLNQYFKKSIKIYCRLEDFKFNIMQNCLYNNNICIFDNKKNNLIFYSLYFNYSCIVARTEKTAVCCDKKMMDNLYLW